MATREQLKNYFLTGLKPTQGQFGTLIDSIFIIGVDAFEIGDIDGLSAALGSKAESATVNSIYVTANQALTASMAREIIIPTDERLANNAGVWTLTWDDALASLFGTAEATCKVLFDNGDGGFKEQKDIPPIYYYTDGAVSSITFEIAIDIQFKIIITR